jgi:hypothetical protein
VRFGYVVPTSAHAPGASASRSVALGVFP